ncbi:MAG: 50S ribosomal protein L3 N(5)-glutamine methyltransferase [Rubrivivax sp.]|nr:50S ribosomal protein L3 N(5)-glutamine methyltransferase [Rubrivivax sp.]
MRRPRAGTLDDRRHVRWPLRRPPVPAGGRVRRRQRQHPPGRRVGGGGQHRAAGQHLPAHARHAARAVTLVELVERTAARLESAAVACGHGTTNAFDEAAWLVLWRLALPLDALADEAGRPVSDEECGRVEALVGERIASRRPTAYLTGEAWLQGVPFHADERAIVPRSLLAEPLVEGVLDALLGDEPADVLDLCTGGGSLAVLAALAWPRVRVLATDLSAPALALAAENVARHGLAGRVTLRRGDGLAALTAEDRFDLVLCNPPYVNARSMAALPAEYRAEPALALAGGDDGMDFVRTLVAGVAVHLKPHGALLLEIGHERRHFEAAFAALSPLWVSTSAGDDAVLWLTREQLAGRSADPVRGTKASPRAPR